MEIDMRTTALFCLGLLPIFGTMLAAQTPRPCLGVSGTTYVNWPQFHSDPCHTGYNASESILSSTNVRNLVLDWKYNMEEVESSPAVANGVVYVGSLDNNVYAISASTGALVWKYTTGGPVYSSPAVVNGMVYVGSGDNKVYAFDAATGHVIWQYNTGNPSDIARQP